MSVHVDVPEFHERPTPVHVEESTTVFAADTLGTGEVQRTDTKTRRRRIATDLTETLLVNLMDFATGPGSVDN